MINRQVRGENGTRFSAQANGSLASNNSFSLRHRGLGFLDDEEFHDASENDSETVVENVTSNYLNGTFCGNEPASLSTVHLSDLSAPLFRLPPISFTADNPTAFFPSGTRVDPICLENLNARKSSRSKDAHFFPRVPFPELVNGHALPTAHWRYHRPTADFIRRPIRDQFSFSFPVSLFRSQMDSTIANSLGLLGHLARTAPVSTHVSPPSEIASVFPTNDLLFQNADSKRSPLTSLLHVSASRPSYPVLYYKRHNHFPSSIYTQSSLSRVRHVRSDEVSQGSSTKLISGSGSVDVAPDESVVVTATLPPLQPASRFRKARIHETVEQWSCGRTSVHDCRLKAVPNWVSELQKKSLVIAKDVAAAVEQKVHCFSCIELHTIDKNIANNRPPKSVDYPEVTDYGQRLTPRGQALYSMEHNRSTDGTTLFSFWDGGFRVACQVPRSISLLRQKNGQLCRDTVCDNCTDSIPVTDSYVLKSDHHWIKSADAPICALHSAFPEQKSRICSDMDAVTLTDGAVTTMGRSSPLRTSFPPSSLPDPATAYLRRQRLECHHSPIVTDGFVKQDDVPTAEELSVDLFDPVQSNNESLDCASRNSPHLFKATSCAPHHTNLSGTDPRERFRAGLPSVNTDVGIAPPTSPALLEDRTQSCAQVLLPSSCSLEDVDVSSCSLRTLTFDGFVDQPNVPLPTNQIKHSTTADLNTREEIAASRFKGGSGCYHNLPQAEYSPRHFGVSSCGHSVAQPLSSPSSPNILHYVPSISQSERVYTTHIKEKLLHNGQSDRSSTKWPLEINVPVHSPKRMGSHALSHRSSNLDWGAYHDCDATKSCSVGSNRLDVRLADSMNFIREAIENAFHHELAAAHAENIGLLSEIDRLRAEVASLRGFQAAFYALRPFVPSDVWKRFITQNTAGSMFPEELAPLSVLSVSNSYPDSPLPRVPDPMRDSFQRQT